MTFQTAVTTCLKKYVTFSGRASRSEYWWFVLFVVGGMIVLDALQAALLGAPEQVSFLSADGSVAVGTRSAGSLSGLFWLALLLPGLAAAWRRMHDTGRSGLHVAYPLIVVVGIGTFIGVAQTIALHGLLVTVALGIALVVLFLSPLVVLWWLTRPSQPGDNEYGPDPHEARS